MVEKKKKREEDRETSWNIVAQNSEFIVYLIQKATNSFQAGNLNKYFWSLISVRDNVNYALQKDERTELDDLEREIKKNMSLLRFTKDVKEYNRLKDEFYFSVRKYHHTILDLLKILGYFPKKESREKMSF